MVEAFANFGYLDGVIVGSLFGYLLGNLEFGELIKSYCKIFIIAVLGCVLSKVYFALGIKIIIFYVGVAFIIRLFFLKKTLNAT